MSSSTPPPPPPAAPRLAAPPPPPPRPPPPPSTVSLAPIASLSEYGAAIARDLADAEASLHAPRARPFAGLSADAAAAVAGLRAEQLAVFRRHVEIERRWRVPAAGGGAGGGGGGIGFSRIADSMQEKEVATAALLERLSSFDRELRAVIGKLGAGKEGE